MKIDITCVLVLIAASATAQQVGVTTKPDWLVNPSPFKAEIRYSGEKKELALANGLVCRTIRLAPNAATVDYSNLVTGEQLLRAVGPEARVTLNGTDYPIGGLDQNATQDQSGLKVAVALM
jgi:hypothetical protein